MCVCGPERCVIRVLDFNHANGATENRGPAEHKTDRLGARVSLSAMSLSCSLSQSAFYTKRGFGLSKGNSSLRETPLSNEVRCH